MTARPLQVPPDFLLYAQCFLDVKLNRGIRHDMHGNDVNIYPFEGITNFSPLDRRCLQTECIHDSLGRPAITCTLEEIHKHSFLLIGRAQRLVIDDVPAHNDLRQHTVKIVLP